jgi:hypothetical protein
LKATYFELLCIMNNSIKQLAVMKCLHHKY